MARVPFDQTLLREPHVDYHIIFLLYPGFEELDLAGPYEVFATASRIVRNDWRLSTASTERTVRSAHGLSVVADHFLDDGPAPDILVVPGGRTQAAIEDERLVSYVRRVATAADLLVSVCTGSLMYWAAGLLEGRRATTYFGEIDYLRMLGGVDVVEDERWVHDGKLVTSAGVSAGIDMALYVVGQLLSPTVARKVQRYIEYAPSPPYQDI